MAKKIKAIVKLQINAGKANPAPPVGPALGQHGVNIMEFCRQYNDKTKDQVGMIIPVEISVYEDRTFSFVTKTPPASDLLLKAAKIEKGSGEPNKVKVGKISRKELEKIAAIKMKDLNAVDMDGAVNIIAGTARSMGLQVIAD